MLCTNPLSDIFLEFVRILLELVVSGGIGKFCVLDNYRKYFFPYEATKLVTRGNAQIRHHDKRTWRHSILLAKEDTINLARRVANLSLVYYFHHSCSSLFGFN